MSLTPSITTPPSPSLKTEELINVIVGFFTDLFLRLKVHQYQLTEFSGIHYPLKKSVFFRVSSSGSAANPFFLFFTFRLIKKTIPDYYSPKYRYIKSDADTTQFF